MRLLYALNIVKTYDYVILWLYIILCFGGILKSVGEKSEKDFIHFNKTIWLEKNLTKFARISVNIAFSVSFPFEWV